MNRAWLPLLAAAGVVLASCEKRPEPPTAPPRAVKPMAGSTGATAAIPPEDGQWTMPAKDYASTRFSGLSDINTGNVKALKVAYTFSLGVDRGQEAAPLVVGS